MPITSEMMTFGHSFINMCLVFCPYLLLGSLIAGVLHYILPTGWIHQHLHGTKGVIKAVLLGIPLPLCSCGVIPAGLGLRKQGASVGSSVGFLISTPQTGVDSILVSAGMLGWPFTWIKVLAALVSGLMGGLWAHWFTSDDVQVDDIGVADHQSTQKTSAWKTVIEHALSILESIWGWILFGIILSALIQTFLPAHLFADLQKESGLLILPLTLLMSLPLYVCATASVPIAAALVSKGLPLTAALVFLMAGPASNAATMGAIYKALGIRVLMIYLSTLVIGSFMFAIVSAPWLQGQIPMVHAHTEEHTSIIAIASSLICLVLLIYFVYQTCKQWYIQHAYTQNQTVQDEVQTYDIQGMSCGGCVRKLEKTLAEIPGVDSWQILRDPDQAHIMGQFAEKELIQKIQDIGFIATFHKK